MDDIFKFLPFALYVVYLLFRKGKKSEENPNRRTRPERRAPRPRSKPVTSLEDILRRIEEEAEEYVRPEPEPAPVQPKVEKQPEVVVEVAPSSGLHQDMSHHVNTGKNMATLRAEMEAKQNLAVDIDVMEVDLKQAVLYDAILNRPYD